MYPASQPAGQLQFAAPIPGLRPFPLLVRRPDEADEPPRAPSLSARFVHALAVRYGDRRRATQRVEADRGVMTALDVLDELLARDVVTDQTRKHDNHRMCAAQLGLHFHT